MVGTVGLNGVLARDPVAPVSQHKHESAIIPLRLMAALSAQVKERATKFATLNLAKRMSRALELNSARRKIRKQLKDNITLGFHI